MRIRSITDAVATAFDGLTAPTGYKAIQQASGRRLDGLGKLPALEVLWTGTRDLNLAYQRREGFVDLTATLWLSKASDTPDVDEAMQAWHDVLIDALVPTIQIGLSDEPNGVQGAYIRSLTPGTSRQLGEEYAVIDMGIEVEIEHSVSSIIGP